MPAWISQKLPSLWMLTYIYHLGIASQFPFKYKERNRRGKEAFCSERQNQEMSRQEPWVDGLLWQDRRGLQML